MTLLDLAEQGDAPPVKKRRVGRRSQDADFFAAYFRARPNTWISALELMQQRACLSFRTRISDLRYAPYLMTIENRQKTVRGTRHSWYRYIPAGGRSHGE